MNGPEAFKCLNGIFCIYKTTGHNFNNILRIFKEKLASDLNSLPCRPPRQIVKFIESPDPSVPTKLVTETDYADHPLVIGPRYASEDIHIDFVNKLSPLSSGVSVLGIGDGVDKLPMIKDANFMEVYHVSGQLGIATDDHWVNSNLIEKSTYFHVTRPKLDRILSAIEASHQKHMYISAGIDIQSQEAYKMAVKGILRPRSGVLGPTIYSSKCISLDPPDFIIEIHGINLFSGYLTQLIGDIGLQAKSTASCTSIRRIRHGQFTLKHALIQKYVNLQNVIENIETCKSFVSYSKLAKRTHLFQPTEKPSQNLLQDGRSKYLMGS